MENRQYTKIMISATVSPNPAKINQTIKISVSAEEVTIDSWYFSGDIYSGET